MRLRARPIRRRLQRRIDLIALALESLSDTVRLRGFRDRRAANPAIVQAIKRSRKFYTVLGRREMARLIFDHLCYAQFVHEKFNRPRLMDELK